MSLKELFIVKKTSRGKGLFASEDIPAFTELFRITGKPASFEQVSSLRENENYCLQTSSECYIVPHYPFILSNHSCEPNCGIMNGDRFITIKSISKGEELVWDYSTSMLERKWTMKCKCGNNNCRKIISDFDTLPSDIQSKYLKLRIVMPYILNELNLK